MHCVDDIERHACKKMEYTFSRSHMCFNDSSFETNLSRRREKSVELANGGERISNGKDISYTDGKSKAKYVMAKWLEVEEKTRYLELTILLPDGAKIEMPPTRCIPKCNSYSRSAAMSPTIESMSCDKVID